MTRRPHTPDTHPQRHPTTEPRAHPHPRRAPPGSRRLDGGAVSKIRPRRAPPSARTGATLKKSRTRKCVDSSHGSTDHQRRDHYAEPQYRPQPCLANLWGAGRRVPQTSILLPSDGVPCVCGRLVAWCPHSHVFCEPSLVVRRSPRAVPLLSCAYSLHGSGRRGPRRDRVRTRALPTALLTLEALYTATSNPEYALGVGFREMRRHVPGLRRMRVSRPPTRGRGAALDRDDVHWLADLRHGHGVGPPHYDAVDVCCSAPSWRRRHSLPRSVT